MKGDVILPVTDGNPGPRLAASSPDSTLAITNIHDGLAVIFVCVC